MGQAPQSRDEVVGRVFLCAVEYLAPRRWHTRSCTYVFVDGVRCAIRKDSLWVAWGRWSGGVCGGNQVCHRLGGEVGKPGPGGKEMFVKQQIICKLCSDFMCPPIWPGWNWREGFVQARHFYF